MVFEKPVVIGLIKQNHKEQCMHFQHQWLKSQMNTINKHHARKKVSRMNLKMLRGKKNQYEEERTTPR